MEKAEVAYMGVDSLIPYANGPRLNDNHKFSYPSEVITPAMEDKAWTLSGREREMAASLGSKGEQ